MKGEVKVADSFYSPTNPNPGIRFQHGPGAQDNTRIMKGDPNAKFDSKRNDYVKITSNGKVLGRDGLEVAKGSDGIKPSHKPEAHIPTEEWLKWRNWNEK